MKIKNMSGGQRQRVAIARALVKNPHLVLADEPTGNLDSRTATAIFEILQKISADCPVVVISHDMQSAEKYADRIITLSDGRIVEDKIKNRAYSERTDILELPQGSTLSEEEIGAINEKIKESGLSVGRKQPKYVDFSGELPTENKKITFEKNKNVLKASRRLSVSFFKNTWVSFFVTIFIAVGILGLLAFAQAFTQFDGKETIQEVAEEYGTKVYVMNKGYSHTNNKSQVDTSKLRKITDEDEEAFRRDGYNGNVYEIYNVGLFISESKIELGKMPETDALYSTLYASEGLGVVVCDREYLTSAFGEIKVLAGSLYGLENSSRIIVTDYFADSLLAFIQSWSDKSLLSPDENDPYQNIIDVKIAERFYIGAVIDTGYRERYAELTEMYEKAKSNVSNMQEILSLIANSDLYLRFLDEANSMLNFGYSLNPNYKEAMIADKRVFSRGYTSLLTTDVGNSLEYAPEFITYVDETLQDDEIILRNDVYAALFGHEYEEGTENYINMSVFIAYKNPKTGDADLTRRLKVKGVSASINGNDAGYAYLSRKTADDCWAESIFPYALLFDKTDEIYVVSQSGQNRYFYTTMKILSPMVTVFNIIEIFVSVFRLIAVVLIAIVFIIILSHNLRLVKKNQYRMGVCKGLGYSSITIEIAGLINLLLLMIAIFVGTVFFSYVFVDLLNDIMVDSFIKYLGITMLEKYSLIEFSMPIILNYMGAIAVLAVFSTIAPLLYIRRLKPNLILNKVE